MSIFMREWLFLVKMSHALINRICLWISPRVILIKAKTKSWKFEDYGVMCVKSQISIWNFCEFLAMEPKRVLSALKKSTFLSCKLSHHCPKPGVTWYQDWRLYDILMQYYFYEDIINSGRSDLKIYQKERESGGGVLWKFLTGVFHFLDFNDNLL